MDYLKPEGIRTKRADYLEPQSLENLHELEHIVEPKPNFVGPGPWIKLLTKQSPFGDKCRKESTHANHRSNSRRR